MKNEPKPKLAIPTCPAWLPAAAKREWRRLVRELNDLRMLARIDRNSLADLCLSVVRLREAEKEIARRGLVFETEDGILRRNPSLITAKAGFCLCGETTSEEVV